MSESKDHYNLALALVAIVLGMSLLAYASVPIYSLFCKITGYGGTTQTTQEFSITKGLRKLTVKFDSNISPNLPWEFKPNQKSIDIITGENALVFYHAKNLSEKPVVGTAIYNVTPYKAAIYFYKIQCFCFNEQLLQPYEELLMPVSFFIDSKFDQDKDLKDITEITLSYTFFKTENNHYS